MSSKARDLSKFPNEIDDVNITGGTIQGVSGSFNFDSGSAGSPSITFDSDTNTGLFRPDADTLAASTNGAERMRIGVSGGGSISGIPGAAIGATSTNGTLTNVSPMLAGIFRSYYERTPTLAATSGTFDLTLGGNYRGAVFFVYAQARANSAFHAVAVVRSNLGNPPSFSISDLTRTGTTITSTGSGNIRITNAGASPDQPFDVTITRIA